MTEHTPARMRSERAPLLWGPLTRFALAVALVAAAIDQAAKLWLLFIFDLGARGIVTLTPSSISC